MTEAAVEDIGANPLAADDVVIEAADPVVQDAGSADPQPDPEPAKDPEPEAKPHHLKGKTPWYMERISAETARRQQVEEQLAQKAREAEEARVLLERLQNGDKQPNPVKTESTQDVEALVEARAAQKILYRESADVRAAGLREYPDFGESLKVLTSVGATGDDFVQDLIDTDKANAHRLIDILAKDPDRAMALVSMPSRRRVAELTRIAMSELNKPAATTAKPNVSRVPPPKPVIDAVSDDTGEMDLANEKLSDSDWSKLWNKRYRKTA